MKEELAKLNEVLYLMDKESFRKGWNCMEAAS